MYKLNWKQVLIFLVILFGGFLRFFKLSEYPIQLNHDEVSQLYDTASIMQTGKDIYGNFLPLAFFSTGDYKVGHYIYINTFSYLLFGNKEFTIRVPAAFFGTLTILAVFLFVNVLTKNWIIAIFSAFLVSITPSEIFYSRKSFENVIGVCLVFFGLFSLINNFLNQKSKIWGFIGIFLLSLAMYIYTTHTIIVPLILFLSAFSCRKQLYMHKKYAFSLFCTWIIFITPLIMTTLINSDLRYRATSVFVSQDSNLGRLISLNGNSFKSYLDFVFLKFLNQINPVYLFINGLDLTNQSIIGIGPLLFIQLPLVILGIIFLIRNKLFSSQGVFLLGLIIISFIPSAITFEDYSPHRAMFAFTNLSIISAFGLYSLILFIKKIINKKIKWLILLVIFSALFLNFVYFIRIYIGSYAFEKSEKMQYPFKKISLYAWSQYNNFNSIILDPKFGKITPIIGVGMHYYLAYYGNVSPVSFQKLYKTGNKPREILFDKFSIREVYWPEDRNLTNTLVIVSPWSVPLSDVSENLIIEKFYFYDGTLAFYAIKL